LFHEHTHMNPAKPVEGPQLAEQLKLVLRSVLRRDTVVAMTIGDTYPRQRVLVVGTQV
jgi:hypothetical protein